MEMLKHLVKVVVQVRDVVALARRFEASPSEAMSELANQVRVGVVDVLERLMRAEIELFLGESSQGANKRNGYVDRTFGIKGIGELRVRVPRDRAGQFESKVVPAGRRYDAAIEKDLALLHLAGLSTRMLSHVSRRVLGLQVSAQEVSNALHTIVPAAKQFLNRPLGDRRWIYLYLDGTFFHVRRTTVDRESTLVVLGVDEFGRKSVLSMIQGDKDSRSAWEMVLADLKERGLDPTAVQLGIMDGLPGLSDAFTQSFLRARVARCWVHKARNVFARVPRRYQAEFKTSWDTVAYAAGEPEAREAFAILAKRWSPLAGDAVTCLERDIDALLAHYAFPKEHWDALRSTNPIERVNKEFKRRSKAMETVSADGLKALLAFTALRLEFGWSLTPIHDRRMENLKLSASRKQALETHISAGLLN